MKINKDALKALNEFKTKPKFEKGTTETQIPYIGLGKPELKSKLTILLNKAADDFILTSKSNPTEKKYQDNIKSGLLRFNPYYLDLDTEDRELICHYFENLMDCVGLESSGGHLNNWIYGFDPTKKPTN